MCSINNYSKEYLGFEELDVNKVTLINGFKHLYVSTTIQAQECPECHKLAYKSKGYGRERLIQGLEVCGYPCILHYKPKRLRCSCGKTFSVISPDIPGQSRLTHDKKNKIYKDLALKISMREVARLNNVELTYVMYLLDKVSYEVDQIGKIFCIDEFKGNLGGEKYQAVTINPITNKVTNIYPSRKKSLLQSEFAKIPRTKRENVEFFICDMWDTYIDLAKVFFRNATIVIDRFHYTKAITTAFDSVRKRIQDQLSDDLRKCFKRSRFLLLKRTSELIHDDKKNEPLKVSIMLGCKYELEKAYKLLQKMYDFNDSTSVEEARHKLINLIYACYDSKIPEFETAAKTLQKYSEYILNSFKTPYTNSYAEGKNTLLKTLKRIGFGYHNRERFLKRIMHIENYR